MSDVIEQLKKEFQDEVIIRLPLISYNNQMLVKYDEIITKIMEQDLIEKANELLNTQLLKNTGSIISLYILGIFELENGYKESQYFEKLFHIFKNVKNWNMLSSLSRKVLTYNESIIALKYLSMIYVDKPHKENTKQDNDELTDIWERIIRLDKTEAKLAEKLAELKELNDETEGAISYYKVALSRYLYYKEYMKMLHCWRKLVQLNPDDINYFNKNEKVMFKVLPPEEYNKLYEDLYKYYFYIKA